MSLADAVPFLPAWVSDPLRVAALAPSSRSLADLITSEIRPASAPVIELGPGTGVFTRALIERGGHACPNGGSAGAEPALEL